MPSMDDKGQALHITVSLRRLPSVSVGVQAPVPLSRKDAVLLTQAPHLVLDGLDAAALAGVEAAIRAETPPPAGRCPRSAP